MKAASIGVRVATPRVRTRDYASIVAPATYVKARALTRKALSMWLEAVASTVGTRTIRSIRDLGCGTGRFSGPLARRFRATVVGVDPSPSMLAQARKAVPESVVFRRGSAECIPMGDGQADLVFMSQTWHHLRNTAQASREMLRVLAPNGRACVRSSTIENMRSYLYLRFFPGARQSYLRRMPRREEIIRAMNRGGFRLARHRAVRQVFSPNRRAYLNKIRQRALSDLAGISDREFAFGLTRLARYCRSGDPDAAVTEQMDLLTFHRP